MEDAANRYCERDKRKRGCVGDVIRFRCFVERKVDSSKVTIFIIVITTRPNRSNISQHSHPKIRHNTTQRDGWASKACWASGNCTDCVCPVAVAVSTTVREFCWWPGSVSVTGSMMAWRSCSVLLSLSTEGVSRSAASRERWVSQPTAEPSVQTTLESKPAACSKPMEPTRIAGG